MVVSQGYINLGPTILPKDILRSNERNIFNFSFELYNERIFFLATYNERSIARRLADAVVFFFFWKQMQLYI